LANGVHDSPNALGSGLIDDYRLLIHLFGLGNSGPLFSAATNEITAVQIAGFRTSLW